MSSSKHFSWLRPRSAAADNKTPDALRAHPARFAMLDPVRGLAALWVFLFHYRFSSEFQHSLPLLHDVFKMGDRAVPLFFVISGFCITRTADRCLETSRQPAEFLQRRMRRIYPTFWCSAIVILLLRSAVLWVYADNAGSMPLDVRRLPDYTGTDWLQVATLTRSFFSEGFWWARYSAVNGAYWTLAIEVQCYLAVAGAMLFKRRFARALTILSIASWIAYVHPRWFLTFAAAGFFLPHWTWFSFGAALHYAEKSGLTPRRVWGRHERSVCGAMVVAFCAGIFACALFSLSYSPLLFAAASAALCWSLLAFDQPFAFRLAAGNFLSRAAAKALVLLGFSSYTLYLLHNEASYFLQMTMLQCGVPSGGVGDLVVVLSTVVLCYLLYTIVERPFVKRPSKNRPDQPAAGGSHDLRPPERHGLARAG